MHIKVVPIGQILMLALLIMLIGIGITAVMKKVNASSKARKRVFWGSIIAGLIIVLLLVILRINEYKIPYTWSLYPWQIVTILKLAIIALAELECMAVMAVVCIALTRPITYAIDKLPTMASKISKWYHNLVK